MAGSGKTRVLTSRIAYMLSTGIKARHILCTTYTKKATQEMTERLSKLISSLQLAQITIGTTHSIGYRILAEELEGVGQPTIRCF
ncbi:ATP-dependent DNA helicase [Bacillus phage SP82G]|nr:ATP-dependent DNA helicase [Bacillus phage SP82G]